MYGPISSEYGTYSLWVEDDSGLPGNDIIKMGGPSGTKDFGSYPMLTVGTGIVSETLPNNGDAAFYWGDGGNSILVSLNYHSGAIKVYSTSLFLMNYQEYQFPPPYLTPTSVQIVDLLGLRQATIEAKVSLGGYSFPPSGPASVRWENSTFGVVVPEPGSSALLGSGLVLLWAGYRHRRSRRDRGTA